MKYDLILLLVLSLTHFVMGLFVVLKSRRDWTNRYFFLFVIGIIGWLLSNYFSNAAGLSGSQILLLNKAVFIFPALCAYFVLMFSLHFTNLYLKIPRWVRLLMGGIAFIVVVVSGTNQVVNGVTMGQNGVYTIIFGTLTPLYFVYQVIYFGLVLPVFLMALRKPNGRAMRNRYQYVVAGISLSFGLVLLTNLIIPLAFGNYAFVSVGPYATLVLIGAITYAIVKHRLFDIRALVARSVAYSLLTLTLAVLYGGIFFGVSSLIFPSSNSGVAQSLLATVLAIVLAFTLQPLRQLFDTFTGKLFYRDRYDSQEVLNSFSQILVSELDLDLILKKTLSDLCRQLNIQYGQLVIFNHERIYRTEHYGALPQKLIIVPLLRRFTQAMLVADELEGGERKRIMEDHGIRVSVMLKTREEFIGYLLLGDKLSGDIYSRQDIELLEIIAKQLAVGIQNAKAYAEIQEFNTTLQARVDHATNRLRVANRHLKELDNAKDEFISMASHQLRTPLTTIKGYLSMILEGDAGKVTKMQTEFVNYAYGSSERMVNLISDLLNVSRLSAGRFLIQTKPTDMVAMITDEVRQLKSHADAKGIGLVFVPPRKPLPMAEIDENKTRQVVMNFIDNAIYYTKVGTVTVELAQDPNGVRLEVHDTGIGVPEVARRKLFTKFFRADNAQTVRPDGTGLGLYLAKRVVEDQGGTIIFNSVEGKGSTFGFTLPLKSKTTKGT